MSTEFKPTDAQVYPWQQEVHEALVRQLEAQKLGHAYLFTGPQGSGKTEFGLAFAKRVLCTGAAGNAQSCNQCQSCLWFEAGTHPDFLHVQPEPNSKSKAAPTLKVDDVRNKISGFATTKAKQRVLLFSADQLNLSATNALLKILEEPPASTLFLLTSHNYTQLLATVLSRVQRLNLSCINSSQYHAYLIQQGAKADQLAALMLQKPGAPKAALELIENGLLDHASIWVKTAQALQSGSRDWASASGYWQSELEINQFIELSLAVNLELMRHLSGLPVQLVAADQLRSFQGSLSWCQAVHEACMNAALALKQNANQAVEYYSLLRVMSRTS